MNLNKAELIGNLTAEPVVKKLPSGNSVASFSVATSHNWKVGKEVKRDVDYHAVVAWGRLAEVVAKYLKKGDKVYLDGRLKTVRHQGKGKNGYGRTQVIAQNLIMLGSKHVDEKEKVNDEAVVEEINVNRAEP